MTMFIRKIPLCGGRERQVHAHLVEDVADRRKRRAHVLRIEAADAADAEGIGDGELPGIDDEAQAGHALDALVGGGGDRFARWPYAPLVRISTSPWGGTKLVSIASTPKVPEPCIGTVTYASPPLTILGRKSSTSRLIPTKAASREPQSWTIASFTVLEVVSGPGVSNSGSPVSEAARLAGREPGSGTDPILSSHGIHWLHWLLLLTVTEAERPLNLTLPRAFHVVAQAGSFSDAARAGATSQPTLSAQVRSPEASYGVSLFDRHGRKLRLTPLGQGLLAVTTRLFAAEEEARDLLAGARTLTRGLLRVAVDSPTYEMPLLALLKERHEKVTFSLRTVTPRT